MKIKGTFTSVWDCNTLIETPAELDTETGEVIALAIDGNLDVDILEDEYFTESESEDEHTICPECHDFILKTITKDGHDVKVCSDPNCENN
jgi:hypothetical protein